MVPQTSTPLSQSTKMKAILIARVSTEEQREAGNSLPAQIVRLEKYCHSSIDPKGRTHHEVELNYK